MNRKDELLHDVVIKFAGDSGDGMQLTGSQFTNNTALLGMDLATFPDFRPKFALLRAPYQVSVVSSLDFLLHLYLHLVMNVMYW
jgi:hypothetical protein